MQRFVHFPNLPENPVSRVNASKQSTPEELEAWAASLGARISRGIG